MTMYDVTPAHRQISLRMYPTPAEQELVRRKMEQSWPHMRPNSTLITAIGNHWKPGCWQKVVDMIQATNKAGTYCAFSEIQDRNFDPFDAMGCMRNESFMMAEFEGFEWLLQIDNDVEPEPDTLLHLLKWDMPIVAPFVCEPGTGKPLHGPPQQVNTGLRPVKWCVLSMVLYNVGVIRAVGSRFWSDPMGADEGYHFMTLKGVAHRPYMDTNTVLTVRNTPHYPLASNRLPKAERDAFWDKKRIALLPPPDRRPINVDDPNVVDGEYMPWAVPKKEPVIIRTGTKPLTLPRTGTKPVEVTA